MLMNSLKTLLTPTKDTNTDGNVEVHISSKSKFTRSASNKKKDKPSSRNSSVKITVDEMGNTRTLLFKSHPQSEACFKNLFVLGAQKMINDNVCGKRRLKKNRVDRELKGYDELYESLGQEHGDIKMYDDECFKLTAKCTRHTPWRKNLH